MSHPALGRHTGFHSNSPRFQLQRLMAALTHHTACLNPSEIFKADSIRTLWTRRILGFFCCCLLNHSIVRYVIFINSNWNYLNWKVQNAKLQKNEQAKSINHPIAAKTAFPLLWVFFHKLEYECRDSLPFRHKSIREISHLDHSANKDWIR